MNHDHKVILFWITLASVVGFALGSFVAGCTIPTPIDPSIYPVFDGGTSTCASASKRLYELDCEIPAPGPDEQLGTPDDMPFPDWCDGFDLFLDLICVERSTSCDAAKKCLE